MKDKVFIAWSGSNTVAMKVKRIMEKDKKYVCSIDEITDDCTKIAKLLDDLSLPGWKYTK